MVGWKLGERPRWGPGTRLPLAARPTSASAASIAARPPAASPTPAAPVRQQLVGRALGARVERGGAQQLGALRDDDLVAVFNPDLHAGVRLVAEEFHGVIYQVLKDGDQPGAISI